MATSPSQSVNELVANLASKDTTKRTNARQGLVKIGSPSVPALLTVIDDPDPHVRWEAAKALAGIADPAAIDKLIEVLKDQETDVRWVAGDALSAIGRPSLVPLLNALVASEDSKNIYEAAHHVLHDFACRTEFKKLVKPVIRALNQPEPQVYVPIEVKSALEGLAELP